MAIHNITKNHFSAVVKKVRAAVLRANYLANGHAQRLILKLMDSFWKRGSYSTPSLIHPNTFNQ